MGPWLLCVLTEEFALKGFCLPTNQSSSMAVLLFYKKKGLSDEKKNGLMSKLRDIYDNIEIITVDAEICYVIETSHEKDIESEKLKWLLSPSFHENYLSTSTHFKDSDSKNQMVIEIGPRLNFSTPFSSNAVSIFNSCGLSGVSRAEFTMRYLIMFSESLQEADFTKLRNQLKNTLHDQMTECEYDTQIESFQVACDVNPWFDVDILNYGTKALEEVSEKLGLAFDQWDLKYYTEMFKNVLKRNPTNVECFDLAQSNSEHSRHWFFKGKLVIDDLEISKSLMQMVMETQEHSNDNNVIKFSDNSSAIKGFETKIFKPSNSMEASNFIQNIGTRHITFTAETHNFPTGVSPFSGATTGTGGRIRDSQAAGRGSHVVAGTAGYCFGNLNIPGYHQPWEDSLWTYPENFARPLDIAIEASNGASDYGNKFGEPIIAGFARSFGMIVNEEERREWIKPIMFTGGMGQIDSHLIKKDIPTKGMKVVKIGGPVYRIGVGGGAASSVNVQGSSEAHLDFDAVQRGDAEMAQKLNRFVRACIENCNNPICSIHDQGAGGNGNVLKEICEPSGAEICVDKFQLGDPTISVMELWGAEYQESDAILVQEDNVKMIETIAHREKCPMSVVGEITDTKHIVLKERSESTDGKVKHPVNLDLSCSLPIGLQKEFKSSRKMVILKKLELPESFSVLQSLQRVLRLPSVASKRYLVVKVDRSVTGLVAQQQCVGPLHIPLADVAVTALSFFDKVGSATAIGEQPIKGLLDPAAGARLSVAESLTNLVFAKLSSRKDVKCSANWMWASKLPGECANIYDACKAMCDIMQELGIAVDGGKDSLSMAARVNDSVVKAPGALVVSTYAQCTDIECTITPDLKCPGGGGVLLHVVASSELKHRLGGSALAQVFSQLGDDVPDVDQPEKLAQAFDIIQSLFQVIKAGHDISDGGLITCLLEMAFAGNCGFNVEIDCDEQNIQAVLFAEEVGWVFEVDEKNVEDVIQKFVQHDIICRKLGNSFPNDEVKVVVNNSEVINMPMTKLRDSWEETSFELDKLQATRSCVFDEQDGLAARHAPKYAVGYQHDVALLDKFCESSATIKVAVLREEGTNGDREMAAALHMAGFQVWDVTMLDLMDENFDLDSFRGLVFPGGFSYADVLGSAKGWAAGLVFNEKLKMKLNNFFAREDSFSFGVCNGCQLMALLGWIAPDIKHKDDQGVVLSNNLSGRFESRFSTVRIAKCPSIMLQGMEDSVLGVWVAHAEGRFQFKNQEILDCIKSKNLVAVQYADDDGNVTSSYPFNPNGSVDGIAGICSENGRHLAMMPHPERCVLKWQWPYLPEEIQCLESSPWLKMFRNAYTWCCVTR